jgi:hypothetical protein
MASREGDDPPTSNKSDESQVLINQRNRFRTVVDYNKPYLLPYDDALLEAYSSLLGDIWRMKAHNPIPREVLAEAEEELTELKKTMRAAGIQFFP